MITVAIIACFVAGYILIAFEHVLHLEKAVPAMLMGVVCWLLLAVGQGQIVFDATEVGGKILTEPEFLNFALRHILGSIAEILLFLIGAMTIVELVDLHHGFSVITKRIQSASPRRLLVLVSIIGFFLSAALDNLTTTIVMISVLRRLVPDREQRLWFVSMQIISANAGGAWTPIGDVTTTMLWIEHKVTTLPLIMHLFIPSVLCLVVPVVLVWFQPVMRRPIIADEVTDSNGGEGRAPFTPRQSLTMLGVGIGALVSVPVFKALTHLPPYMGMMVALSVVWLVSEFIHPDPDFHDERRGAYFFSPQYALTRIEMSSILFFLGILLGVAALETAFLREHGGEPLSVLHSFALQLNEWIPNDNVVVALTGLLSAIIDNVPLVAAATNMYDWEKDAQLWHFLAYAAGTGGSMLVIGSAAGVAAMGLEKINFFWYFRNITWLAMSGYFAGCIYIVLANRLLG